MVNLDPFLGEIRQFLRSSPGVAVLQSLKENRPELTGKDFEETALKSMEAAGWEKCIRHLESMMEPAIPGAPTGHSYINPIDEKPEEKS